MSPINATGKKSNGVNNSTPFLQRSEIQEVINIDRENNSSTNSLQSNATTESENAKEEYQIQMLTPVPLSQLQFSISEATFNNFQWAMQNQQVTVVFITHIII